MRFSLVACIVLFFLSSIFASYTTPNALEDSNICVPDFRITTWSDCIDSKQSRFILDLNSCFRDKEESRTCQTDGLSELETQFLNTYELKVTDLGGSRYSADLNSNYSAIFYVTTALVDDIFILGDRITGVEYIGRLVEQEGVKYYYSLIRIDAGYLGQLKEVGLIETGVVEDVAALSEEVARSNSFPIVLSVIGFMLGLTIILFIIFMVKRHHKSPQASSAVAFSDLKNHLVKPHVENQTSNQSQVTTSSNQPSSELRGRLEKAGWSRESLNNAFGKSK